MWPSVIAFCMDRYQPITHTRLRSVAYSVKMVWHKPKHIVVVGILIMKRCVPVVIGTGWYWYQLLLVPVVIGACWYWYQLLLVSVVIGNGCYWYRLVLVPVVIGTGCSNTSHFFLASDHSIGVTCFVFFHPIPTYLLTYLLTYSLTHSLHAAQSFLIS